jgi:hypothetical protein
MSWKNPTMTGNDADDVGPNPDDVEMQGGGGERGRVSPAPAVPA